MKNRHRPFPFRYEKLKPTAESFDSDITKYTLIVNSVQMQDTVMTVHFLDVNADRLKGAIVEQCSIWQQKLIGLLLQLTDNLVNHVYYYITENTRKLVTPWFRVRTINRTAVKGLSQRNRTTGIVLFEVDIFITEIHGASLNALAISRFLHIHTNMYCKV